MSTSRPHLQVTGEDISDNDKHDMIRVLNNAVARQKDENSKGQLSLETFEDLVLSKVRDFRLPSSPSALPAHFL